MSARDYAAAVARVAPRALRSPRLGREERLVFVVGCPRSGTTFLGSALGSQPGFVDLDEVTPWKAALPSSPGPEELRRILERVRLLGLASGLRGVEQTPETAFVLPAALAAYPRAQAVHSLRDGRDVVCSLLERGWFGSRGGADDAGLAYGPHARFWVEPERREEFAASSDTCHVPAGTGTCADPETGCWPRSTVWGRLAPVGSTNWTTRRSQGVPGSSACHVSVVPVSVGACGKEGGAVSRATVSGASVAVDRLPE